MHLIVDQGLHQTLNQVSLIPDPSSFQSQPQVCFYFDLVMFSPYFKFLILLIS